MYNKVESGSYNLPKQQATTICLRYKLYLQFYNSGRKCQRKSFETRSIVSLPNLRKY